MRHVGGITSVFLDRRSPPPLGAKLKGSQASLTDRLPIPVRRVSDSFRPTDPDPAARSAAKKIEVGPTDLLSGGVRAPTTLMTPRPTTLTFTPWAVLYPTTTTPADAGANPRTGPWGANARGPAFRTFSTLVSWCSRVVEG